MVLVLPRPIPVPVPLALPVGVLTLSLWAQLGIEPVKHSGFDGLPGGLGPATWNGLSGSAPTPETGI
jgi:hypothetical protein